MADSIHGRDAECGGEGWVAVLVVVRLVGGWNSECGEDSECGDECGEFCGR